MSRVRCAAPIALLAFGLPSLGQAPCSSCPSPSFGPSARAYGTRYAGQPASTTSPASGVVVGDFNDDGVPDVVAGGSIFLGTGSGSFLPARPLPYSFDVVFVAADFDGDGNLDLATEGRVLLGDGAGGFRVREWPLPVSVGILAAGDFNGDGIPDLATAPFSGNELTILLGVGDATFVRAQTLQIGSGAGSFAHLVPRVGDFNGDGIDDVAVLSVGDGRIGLVLGRPSGPFSVLDVPSPFAYGTALLVGDFDGDGNADLLAEGGASFGSQRSLWTLLGKGDGTFRTGSSFVSGYATSVQAGDFTGDGKPDVVLIRSYDSDTRNWGLFVFPGVGDGSFGPPERTQTAGDSPAGIYDPNPLAAGDLDLDGRLDLIVARGPAEAFAVLRGKGDGSFEESPRFTAGVQDLRGIAKADFDNDGRPDVVVSAYVSSQIAVLRGDGTGGFLAPVVTTIPSLGGSPVVADFDGDGNVDVAISDGSDGIYTLLGKGDGSFRPPVGTRTGYTTTLLTAADIDGDGKSDLVFSSWSTGVFFLKGNGDGTFQPPTMVSQSYVASVFVGDVNGDGKKDIVYTTSGILVISLDVILGAGDGTFSAPIETRFDGPGTALALGDVNGDGKLDVVVTSGFGMGVLLGDGTGNFASPIRTEAQGDTRQAVLVDLNGDGFQDLVVAAQQYVLVLPGLGDGRFDRRQLYTLPGTPVGAVVGAFHGGSARPDIVVACVGSSDTPPDFVSVLSNASCQPRRLSLSAGAAACVSPGRALMPAPVVRVLDDADNVVACASGAVTASLVPGTGAPGAVLSGTLSLPPSGGVASFADLSIDRAGAGNVIEFRGSAGATRTRPFRVGSVLPVAISGPASLCSSATYGATPGFETYGWSVDGIPVGGRAPFVLDGHAIGPGAHTLRLTAKSGGCASVDTIPIRVVLPDVRIAAPATACPLVDGVPASVPDAGPGATYTWTVTNGAITSGAGTRAVTLRPGPAGDVSVSVAVANGAGCSDSGSATFPVARSVSCPPPAGFFALPPCRVLDTRGPVGPSGGPVLSTGFVRDFPVSGVCGVPADAVAVAGNLTVTGSKSFGYVSVRAGGVAHGGVDAIWFSAGQTRANNLITSLGAKGDVGLGALVAPGDPTVHVILDVSGYFR